MARCLILGCGCRGRSLARELSERGYAVRGTTRQPPHARDIEAAGAEAIVADPNRIATLTPSLAEVSVVCVLLGSAVARSEELAALHGTRLEMLLQRMLDTPVRGIVYEAGGTVDPSLLEAGGRRVAEFCRRSRIGSASLIADPADAERWLEAAVGAVERALAPR